MFPKISNSRNYHSSKIYYSEKFFSTVFQSLYIVRHVTWIFMSSTTVPYESHKKDTSTIINEKIKGMDSVLLVCTTLACRNER